MLLSIFLGTISLIAILYAVLLSRRTRQSVDNRFTIFNITTRADLLVPLMTNRPRLAVGAATLHDRSTIADMRGIHRPLPVAPQILLPIDEARDHGIDMTNIWIEGKFYPVGMFLSIQMMWYEFPDKSRALLYKMKS